MEIRQLEHFVAAVEHGTLRAAAEASHISQPGISLSLGRLEDFLGAKLLERKPRGVAPTAYGDLLFRHAKVVLAHVRHARLELAALRGDGASELRIGVGASFMNRALPRVVARMLDREPGLTLNIDEGVAEDQIPKLLEADLDLVLVRFPSTPPHDALIYEALHRRALCACTRAGHPLANQRSRVTLDDLSRARWIFPDEVPEEILAAAYRVLNQSGRAVRPAVQTNSVPFIKRLLQESDCVALLPEGAIVDEIADGRLRAIEVGELDLEDEVGAVYRRELAGLPVLSEVIAALREELPRAGLTVSD